MDFLNDGKPNLNEMMHYGVKGMHWGQHKIERTAKSDAKEFARAQQFYGEGAGTRRKLIKATVEGRSKNVAGYKEAFDRHLANQDMAKHASKAKSERKRKDVAKGTAKTARGIKNIINGNAAYASLGATLLVGGALAAHKTGIDKVILDAGKTKLRDLRGTKIKAGMSASDLLDAMGLK